MMQYSLLPCLLVAVLVLESPVVSAYNLRRSSRAVQNGRQLLVRYLKAKADRINPAFADELSAGVTHSATLQEEYGGCQVSGVVTYSIQKVAELYSKIGATTLEPIEGSQDLWELRTTIDSFNADMTAQVLGKRCGHVMDFTSFGHINVDSAAVKATIRLNGPSNRPEVVDFVNVEDHRIEFETTSATFSKLVQRIPLEAVERDMNDFIHALFTAKFQSVMEGELTRSSS